MTLRLVALILLLCSATAMAEAPPASTSYRTSTLAADAIGLGLLVAGGLAEGDGGRDTPMSDALFATGGLTIMLATPIIHAAHGHRERSVGSFLLRGGMAGAGMLLAISANSGCDDGKPPSDGAIVDGDFLCELDYIGYGVLGGLVVASVIDAAFLTEKAAPPRSTWAPQLAASRDGVRAGVVVAW